MTHLHRITAPAGLAEVTARAASLTPHLVPLLRAASTGLIWLVIPPERSTSAKFLRETSVVGRPCCVLIGDDDYASTGPDGWACAHRLPWWAKAAIVHGTGGRPEHHAAVVQFTLGYGRLVLIETDSAHMVAWRAPFVSRRVPVLMIQPPDDGPHPVQPPRGQMQ